MPTLASTLTVVAAALMTSGLVGAALLRPRANQLAVIGRSLALGPFALVVGLLVHRAAHVEQSLRNELRAVDDVRARCADLVSGRLVSAVEPASSTSVKLSLYGDDLSLGTSRTPRGGNDAIAAG